MGGCIDEKKERTVNITLKGEREGERSYAGVLQPEESTVRKVKIFGKRCLKERQTRPPDVLGREGKGAQSFVNPQLGGVSTRKKQKGTKDAKQGEKPGKSALEKCVGKWGKNT